MERPFPDELCQEQKINGTIPPKHKIAPKSTEKFLLIAVTSA